jgi:LPXTG-site transpeptidase (sortase) family protein
MSLKTSIVVIAFAAIIIFFMNQVFLTRFTAALNEPRLPPVIVAATARPSDISGSLPIRLNIPEINVDTVIQDVGFTPQGSMGVPVGPTTVAWFDLGPRPGEPGNAVIDGHEGWKDNIPAVFDNLYKLHPGDKIYIEDENGTLLAFTVQELETYGEYQSTSDVFEASEGGAHLNLITCEGRWNATTKSYSDRLVVFADAEPNED